jgi:hypothetical protein
VHYGGNRVLLVVGRDDDRKPQFVRHSGSRKRSLLAGGELTSTGRLGPG